MGRRGDGARRRRGERDRDRCRRGLSERCRRRGGERDRERDRERCRRGLRERRRRGGDRDRLGERLRRGERDLERPMVVERLQNSNSRAGWPVFATRKSLLAACNILARNVRVQVTLRACDDKQRP